MSSTNRLKMPYLLPSQAQKHVTHNEALSILDVLVQPVATAGPTNNPPEAPQDGAIYIVSTEPTGDWLGYAGHVAAFQDGWWRFLYPADGWQFQIKNSDYYVIRVNGSWETVAQFNPSAISQLGIGTVPNVPLHVAVNSGISTIRIQSGNEGAYGSPFADLSHDGASFFFTNWAEGNVAFTAARPGSSVAFGAGGAVRLRVDQAALFPESDVGLSLGNSQRRWSEIWCNSGIVQTSDRRDKDIIGRLPRSAETIVDSVTPAIFAWKNDKKIGRNTELNVGFIAQELAACLKESGISVAACGISEEEKEGGRYWVKPDQLLALLWHSLKITRERLLEIEKEILKGRK